MICYHNQFLQYDYKKLHCKAIQPTCYMTKDNNGNQRQMSIYEYLFIHAHRLHDKKQL